MLKPPESLTDRRLEFISLPQPGVLAGFERLDLPEADGVVPAAVRFEPIDPATLAGLTLHDDVARFLRDLVQIGDIDFEAFAESVGLRKGVGGDAMVIHPLDIV